MVLDFNRTCNEPSHADKKIPLIGIEPSGTGIRYVFGCGHGLIIQAVGDPLMKEISDTLRKNAGKSLDELYEELATIDSLTSQVKYAKKRDKKWGQTIFQGFKPYLRSIICDEFKFCEKMDYFQVAIPPAAGVLIGERLIANNPDLNAQLVPVAISILVSLPLIELKKWCNC